MATTRKNDDGSDAPDVEVTDETGGTSAPGPGDPVVAPPTDEQKAQVAEDNQVRIENPDTFVGREANPDFGGESFGYLSAPE